MAEYKDRGGSIPPAMQPARQAGRQGHSGAGGGGPFLWRPLLHTALSPSMSSSLPSNGTMAHDAAVVGGIVINIVGGSCCGEAPSAAAGSTLLSLPFPPLPGERREGRGGGYIPEACASLLHCLMQAVNTLGDI